MPNIPVAPTFAQTDTEALPTPYDKTDKTIPAQAIAGVGKIVGQVGEAAAGLIQKAKDQADVTAVQEAETKYNQELQRRLYGGQNPDTGEEIQGFKALKGHSALESSAQLNKDFEESQKKVAGGLANSRQRQLFLARTQAELIGAQRQVEQHTSEQDQYLKTESFKTNMRTSAQSAVNAYGDPLERQRQIESTRPWLELEAERQGLRGADAEVFVQKYQGAMAEEVLQRLMGDEGRSSDAKAFFEQNRQRIGPDAHKYEASLKRLSTVEEASSEVKRIEQAFFDDPAAQEKAVAALPGEVGAKALDIFRERMATAESARRAADNARLGTTLDNIEASRVRNSGQLEHDLSFQRLSDDGKAKAREHLRLMLNSQRINDAEWRRVQREADAAALNDFLARPVEERASLDARQIYTGNASPDGINRIRAQQLKAKAEWSKDQGVGEVAFDKLVQSEAQQVLPDKRDMEDFKGSMRRLRSNWLEANPGKVPPREEVTKWIAEQLTRKDVPWGFDKFVYRLSPEDAKNYGNASDQPYGKQRQALPQAQQIPTAAAPATVPTRKSASAVSEIPQDIQAKLRQDYDGWRVQHPGARALSDADLLREYNKGLAGGEW